MGGSTKRTIGLTGGFLALASIGFSAYKASKEGVRVEVEQEFSVPSRFVIDLISRVELETDLVPLVSRVEIFDRQSDEVTYEVGFTSPLPMRVVYTKWWDYDGKWVAWKSLIGSMGVFHTGEIHFEDTEHGCKATLISVHKFTTPVIGGTASIASEPVIWAAMRGWMKRLADTFNKELVQLERAEEAALAAAS